MIILYTNLWQWLRWGVPLAERLSILKKKARKPSHQNDCGTGHISHPALYKRDILDNQLHFWCVLIFIPVVLSESIVQALWTHAETCINFSFCAKDYKGVGSGFTVLLCPAILLQTPMSWITVWAGWVNQAQEETGLQAVMLHPIMSLVPVWQICMQTCTSYVVFCRS